MQDILAYTDHFETWTPGPAYAADLAAGLGAALTGVYVCPSPTEAVAAYDAPELLAEFLETTRLLEDRASRARTAFIEWASRRGVHSAEWQVAEGYVPRMLEHIGNWHDLLVLERAAESPWGSATELGNIVLTSGLPCIVVPPRMSGARTRDCLVLAWNGSPEAIRAIHAARPFMATAKRVVVLSGEPRERAGEIGWQQEFDLNHYLGQHGVQAEVRPLATDTKEVGPGLLEAAAEVGADMLVMGAYGRTRFSEWAFGGATRHVLSAASIPVLMRH